MGTRSNTIIFNGTDRLVNIYRQMDGYPSGHGAQLAEFLAKAKMVNGIGDREPHLANGMGCLAAQVIAHLKTDVGSIYIHSLDDGGNDYTYEVHGDTMKPQDGLTIRVLDNEEIFNGTPAEFLSFCNSPQDA